jgi:multisubunit Na+/H+ antiporter MnhG subunit
MALTERQYVYQFRTKNLFSTPSRYQRLLNPKTYSSVGITSTMISFILYLPINLASIKFFKTQLTYFIFIVTLKTSKAHPSDALYQISISNGSKAPYTI